MNNFSTDDSPVLVNSEYFCPGVAGFSQFWFLLQTGTELEIVPA